MIRSFTPFLGLLLTLCCRAQIPSDFLVQKLISDNNYGYSVSRAPDRGAYVSGHFYPHYRSKDTTGYGGFLIKYRNDGSIAWEKRFESRSYVVIMNTSDPDGNVYSAIRFASKLIYPEGAIYPFGGGIMLLKYDPDGRILFAKHLATYSFVKALSCDNRGNIYIAARASRDTTLIDGFSVAGNYIAKLNPTGSLIWSKSILMDLVDHDFSFNLTVDSLQNIYTTGTFEGTRQFQAGQTIQSTEFVDAFVCKYDSLLNLQWVNTISGKSLQFPQAIGVNHAGEVFVGGCTVYTTNFSGITVSIPDSNGTDIFLAKYNASGAVQWVKTAVGDGYDYLHDLYIDKNSNILVTGDFGFYGKYLEIGGSHLNATNHGGRTFFLAQYNSDGEVLQVKGSEGKGGGSGFSIAGNDEGDIFCTGGFGGIFGIEGRSVTCGTSEMYLYKFSYDMNNKVGISDQSLASQKLNAFPVPSDGRLYVDIPDDGLVIFTLYEQTGQKMKEIYSHAPSYGCTRIVDLDISPGVYLLQSSSVNGVLRKKIVIN